MPAPTAAEALAEPLDPAAFAAAMAALGPFEPRPHLAIAASGGADSLALMSLAAGWLAARGGRGTVLTVDHGLRPAAALEALWTRDAAHALGLDHVTLRWAHDGRRRSAAAARDARYALLDEALAELGCLHLLVAHHADDQAVTRAMRARRGEGPGLAGMAAVRELRHGRLLRPLLACPKARLQATARALGRGWIEDPSNRDPARERSVTAPLARDDRVAVGRMRAETWLADWLARNATLDDHGTVALAAAAFDRLAPVDRVPVLAAATATVGGRRYLPSARMVEGLLARLADGRATLAGAVVERCGGWLCLRRELARIRPLRLDPGETGTFDGRFAMANRGTGSVLLVPLGAAAAAHWVGACRQRRVVLATLPARLDASGRPSLELAAAGIERRWAPRRPLAGAPFAAGRIVSRCGLPT